MTTFICFVIAMVFLYVMQLLNGGFEIREFIAFILMIAILGSHVYLTTRKKAIFGIIVPLFLIATFFPVYKIIHPTGSTLIVLILVYIIAIGCCLYIWYRARLTD